MGSMSPTIWQHHGSVMESPGLPMASHGSFGSKSRPWRPAGHEPGPRCTANRSLFRVGDGGWDLEDPSFHLERPGKLIKSMGKSMGKSWEFDLENHESSCINIWHIWSWGVFLYLVFLLKMICLSVSWDFFTRQTRHFSIFPQLCRPGTVRRHVHFEDDAVLSEGVALSWGRQIQGIQCAPWAPKRDLQGVFCFFIWLVVNQPLWKNIWKSMGRMTSHILWKIKNVWNHQPVIVPLLLKWAM